MAKQTLDQAADMWAPQVCRAVRELKEFLRSGTDTDHIRTILRSEIEDNQAVSDMKVLAAFVADEWD